MYGEATQGDVHDSVSGNMAYFCKSHDKIRLMYHVEVICNELYSRGSNEL